MFPLFDQRWGVFAPVPREESRVFYKFFSNDSWSKEFSFHEEMEKKNHINAGRIADMTSFYLGEETRQYAVKNNDQIDYSAVKTSYYYKRVLYTIYAHILQEQAQEKPDSIILILERDLFPKKGYSTKKIIRDYFKPDACE